MTGYGLDDDDDDEYDDYDGSDTEGGDLLNRQKPARKSVTWADPIDDGGEGGPTAVATAAVAGAEVAPRADGGDRAAGAVVVAVAEAPSSSASGREVVDEAGLGFQIGAVHLLKKQARVKYILEYILFVSFCFFFFTLSKICRPQARGNWSWACTPPSTRGQHIHTCIRRY